IRPVREDPRRSLGGLVLLPSPLRLVADQLEQPWVLGQPQEVIDAVGFTPGHDRIAAESAVAAEDDRDLGPGSADPRTEPLNLLQGSGAGIDVRGAEPGTQQMIAAENVQR